MAFQPANRTLILRGLTCLLTLAGLVLLLAAVAPGESGELVVSWEAPAGDGGWAISGYKVQWKSGSEDYDGTPKSTRQAIIAGDRLTHTVSDLKDGTEYTVRVIATNGAGDGYRLTLADRTGRVRIRPIAEAAMGNRNDGIHGFSWMANIR